MGKKFIEAYWENIRQSVGYYSREHFSDTNLEFVVESNEDYISYVDRVYMKDATQTLYLFSDEKIRRVSLEAEGNNFEINSSSLKVENITNIKIRQRHYNDTLLTIEFIDGENITLDSNNAFEHWKRKASDTLKLIYKKYY